MSGVSKLVDIPQYAPVDWPWHPSVPREPVCLHDFADLRTGERFQDFRERHGLQVRGVWRCCQQCVELMLSVAYVGTGLTAINVTSIRYVGL